MSVSAAFSGISSSYRLGILILLLAACGSPADDSPPPTIMQMPTLPPGATPTATITPSATVTLTPTFPPTDTLAPTDTLTATGTRTATLTPSATPPPDTATPSATTTPVKIIIQSAVGAFARSGPDTNYPVVGEVGAGDRFDAAAFTVNADGEVWYLIRLPNTLPAWVSQHVAARVDDAPLGQIAMAVTVPPSPTLSPTPTLTHTPTFTPTPELPPGANARVHAASRVNLRSGPDLTYRSLGLLAPSAPLAVLGRNDADTWLQANTFDGRAGWVLTQLVEPVTIAFAALPVTWSGPPVPEGLVFTSSVIQSARDIFARGQQMGNRPNGFIVIGDSTIANTPEWKGIFSSIRNNTYHLGSYTDLQMTIEFFRSGNSFGADFETARAGYATRYILDPSWADPSVCNPGENVLTCEIRRSRPAFAIIYIGHIDMQGRSTSGYAQNLDTIVRTLMASGVIPVLNTVTYSEAAANAITRRDWLPYMNTTIQETAARYNLPLVDFQSAAAALPNQGCIPDGRHLSYGVDGVVNFNGDQRLFGKDLRELMNLQMMEALRAHVFQG